MRITRNQKGWKSNKNNNKAIVSMILKKSAKKEDNYWEDAVLL